MAGSHGSVFLAASIGSALRSGFGPVVVVAVLVVLLGRELTLAAGGKPLLVRWLTIALAPLLVAFVITVAQRLMSGA